MDQQIIYLDYLRPISEFVYTDDEDQPELILKLDNGLIFHGQYDPHAGMFFADFTYFAPETKEQEEYMKNCVLPDRLYGTVVEFQYC